MAQGSRPAKRRRHSAPERQEEAEAICAPSPLRPVVASSLRRGPRGQASSSVAFAGQEGAGGSGGRGREGGCQLMLRESVRRAALSRQPGHGSLAQRFLGSRQTRDAAEPQARVEAERQLQFAESDESEDHVHEEEEEIDSDMEDFVVSV